MNKKGVTMISLVFYILSFIVVVGVIGSISIYITKNMDYMSSETEPKYAQNQLDRYFRKFLNRKDSYEILNDNNNDSQYIKFTKLGTSKETNIIRYYPESLLSSKGYMFLEVRKNGNLEKKIVFANNVAGLKIYETETALGKIIEIELSALKGDEIINSVSSYGVER